MKDVILYTLMVCLLFIFAALLAIQMQTSSDVIDSCHNGDFFRLRGKVYKCVWVGSQEFINGGIK
jgi:hypothetical protein